MGKGSSFEREICKLLSGWWSKDIEGKARDDIFWRSSQSGGRATIRARQGKRTFGSYGDITAVDPIGGPLLQAVTIELKRGRSHGTPEDLVDMPSPCAIRPFEHTLDQVLTSQEDAMTPDWLLVSRRDRRPAVAYFSSGFFEWMEAAGVSSPRSSARYRLQVRRRSGAHKQDVLFYAMKLDKLLSVLKPRLVQAWVAAMPDKRIPKCV